MNAVKPETLKIPEGLMPWQKQIERLGFSLTQVHVSDIDGVDNESYEIKYVVDAIAPGYGSSHKTDGVLEILCNEETGEILHTKMSLPIKAYRRTARMYKADVEHDLKQTWFSLPDDECASIVWEGVRYAPCGVAVIFFSSGERVEIKFSNQQWYEALYFDSNSELIWKAGNCGTEIFLFGQKNWLNPF